MLKSEVKVGIYCRLSQDDGTNYNESVSISNQREILTKYANDLGFEIVDYYIDDGYSGLNFNRPGFRRMMHDCELGRINTIITKDLSRLGRDHIMTDYYITTYFPDRDIRYIAYSENIDTSKGEDEILPLRSFVNEMMAKDVSKKVTFTITNQMKTGKDVKTGVPLYGYMYDSENRRIPNPETAPVIELIFRLFLEGNTYAQIAKILEEKEIITPQYYAYLKYGYGKGTLHFTRGFYSWNRKTVRSMLLNDEYTGTFRRGKSKQQFKTKKKKIIKKEDQYIFENKYEPIISKEIFDEAQFIASSLKETGERRTINKYVGLVYCGICGKALRHRSSPRVNNKDFVRLSCRAACSNERGTILYEDLDKILKKEIMDLRNVILNNKDAFLTFAKKASSKALVTDEYSILINERKMCEKEIAKKEEYIKTAYEHKVDGILTDSIYNNMMQEYNDIIEKLETRIEVIDSRIENEKITKPDYEVDANNFVKALEQINPITCLQAVNLNLIISKIYVSTDGKKKRREKMNKKITIVYIHIDGIIKEFINNQN